MKARVVGGARPRNIAIMPITVAPVTGPALHAVLDDLARLRITVFREYPYLYDGTLDYEAGYLRRFGEGKDAVIVLAKDDERIVGCSTGSALSTQHEPLRDPFRDQGYDVSSVFYCGESVLLPDHRGSGIGHQFFDHREAHARACGYQISAFCAVIRPDDHPARPADYRPHDAFWSKRGYRKIPELIAHFGWKDVGGDGQSDKPMQFWLRDLV